MPTSMTFTSLLVDLRRYCERGDSTDPDVFDQLPRLINNAEREIAKDIKLQGFIRNVTSDLVIGTSVYQKPDRWRETISMNFGIGSDQNQRVDLFPRSYEYCNSYWPNRNLRAQPEFYADYNYSHWLIIPTPSQGYPWEINYYEMPALLDDSNQTNWLTDYDPTLLLYRSLLECQPFLKKDERIATWQQMYQSSLQAVNLQDIEKVVDRSTTRQKA
jgi:hypothetical protein